MPEAQAGPEIWASPAVTGMHAGAVLGFGLVSTRRAPPNGTALHEVPAWVGFTWGGWYGCPAIGATPSPAPHLPSNGYVAVVVGSDAWLTYAARSSPCGGPPTGPRIEPASQVISVAWHRAGPIVQGRVRLDFTLPPCGRLFGMNAGGDRTTVTITVDGVAPDAPLPCPMPVPTSGTLALTAPGGGPPPTVLRHGSLGLVRQLQLS